MVAALVTAFLLPMPAAVGGDDDVRSSGSCTRNSNWKLKLSPDEGRIEVEYEVDQNVNGQKWRVTLRNDGVRFFSGRRTTQPPSGSFEVRRLTGNGPGADRITARARNLSTDELCRGSASI